MLDFITDRVVSGNWTIETYKSGKVVMLATMSISVVCDYQGGGIWVSGGLYTVMFPYALSSLKFREWSWYNTQVSSIVHQIRVEGTL